MAGWNLAKEAEEAEKAEEADSTTSKHTYGTIVEGGRYRTGI